MTDKETPNLASGHRERLRARLEAAPEAVQDYEILELLLGLALKRKDTKPLAKILIQRFGGLRGCFDATREELLQVEGFGTGLAGLWILLKEFMARYAAAPLLERKLVANPETVAEMANARLGHLSHEESWLALLNTRNMLIGWEKISEGSLDFVPLEPRAIFQAALAHNASGIILVHNHPGGNPLPSNADVKLTRELRKLAPQLGLRFLDHIIVAAGKSYSFEKEKILRNAGGNNGS